jgi:hypothetical protein
MSEKIGFWGDWSRRATDPLSLPAVGQDVLLLLSVPTVLARANSDMRGVGQNGDALSH